MRSSKRRPCDAGETAPTRLPLARAVACHPSSPIDALRAAGIGSDEVRWADVLRRDPCSYCGRRYLFGDMTVDHIVAFARGAVVAGAANGAAACRACNESKGAASVLEVISGFKLSRPLPKVRPVRKQKRNRTRPKPLEVHLSKNARAEAHRDLGVCPDDGWWRAVAERISARTLEARSLRPTSAGEEGWWVVPVTSCDGVNLDVHLRVQAVRRNATGEAKRIYILGVRVELAE